MAGASGKIVWVGRVISGLASLAFFVSAGMKLKGGPEVIEGTLIYVRNAMTDRATWDARAHQLEDPRFPHNSTVDQLYTDKKFESYRVLGARAAGRAMKAMKAA